MKKTILIGIIALFFSSNIAWATNFTFLSGYNINASTVSGGTLSDGATHYLCSDSGVSSTEGLGRCYISQGGTLTKIYGNVFVGGTLGSSETASFYVRVNGTTDYLISSSIVYTATNNTFSNTGLSIPLSSGDYIQFKMIYPTWATNPTGVRPYFSAFVNTSETKSINEESTTTLPWSSITSTPTTLSGYGIISGLTAGSGIGISGLTITNTSPENGLSNLPSQTGNSGKYLTTNGTIESWGTISGGGGGCTTFACLTGTENVFLLGNTTRYGLLLFLIGVLLISVILVVIKLIKKILWQMS